MKEIRALVTKERQLGKEFRSSLKVKV